MPASNLTCLMSSSPVRVSASIPSGQDPPVRFLPWPEEDYFRVISVALEDHTYLTLERTDCSTKRTCLCLALLPLCSLGRWMASQTPVHY